VNILQKAEKELVELAGSDSFRKDMEILNRRHTSPFMKDGNVDVDAYIEFITQFNEFINHQPKPFRPIIDRVMKL
jgi:hypothetical protein